MSMIKKGKTDVTRYVKLVDAITGVPETGLTITDLDLQYTRHRAIPAAKVDVTALAATNSVHAANKMIEIDAISSPGLYRVDWPDAAFADATGVDTVELVVSGVAIDPAIEEIELVEFDPQDPKRMGMTALPNAVADGAGGLPISDIGGLDMDLLLKLQEADLFVNTGTTPWELERRLKGTAAVLDSKKLYEADGTEITSVLQLIGRQTT